MENIVQDFRYALRGLRRRPGFTLAVVATLALGIGVNAAMFGVTDRLLFRAPAFMTEPQRAHRVYLGRTIRGSERVSASLQYTRFRDLESWTSSFDATAAFTDAEPAVGTGADTRVTRIAAVSAGFWAFFDVRPVLGRVFTAAEDAAPAGARVALLTYPAWQTRYGGEANVLGRQIRIGRADYEIIGVLPPGFTGLAQQDPALYVPVTAWGATEMGAGRGDPTGWYQTYDMAWLHMVARRKPGVSIEQATADLTQAFGRSYEAHRRLTPSLTAPDVAKPRAIAAPILQARGPQATQLSKVARWVSAVALVVLLVATANVANLLLGRALQRRREIAVRLALGVSRTRLLTQLLTESLVLAALGGAVGVIVAQWAGAVLRAQFIPDDTGMSVLGDGRTMLFAGTIVIVVGILTGLAPALHLRRGDVSAALKSGEREGTFQRSRTRTALLVAQAALSVVLLVAAGLFVRSLLNVRGLGLGYDLDRLMWVAVQERGERLEEGERIALRNRLVAAARTIPQVENASRAVAVPFVMAMSERIYVDGRDTAWLAALGGITVQGAAPEYLATVGTRLLRGRNIGSGDTRDAPPVTLVSQALAAALWSGDQPLGRCIRIGAPDSPCTEVVGVVENVRVSGEFEEDRQFHLYRPIDQVDPAGGGLFVRTRGEARPSEDAVRRALQGEMPGTGYVIAESLTDIFGPSVRSWRLGTTMFVAFGGLALALAALGLYSVVAYNVAQRTHELGVRMAFGAGHGAVVRLVLLDGLRWIVLGTVIGVVGALYAGKWIAALLFRVSPTDPLVFACVAGLLLVAATCGSLIPALRATRVDPIRALRSD